MTDLDLFTPAERGLLADYFGIFGPEEHTSIRTGLRSEDHLILAGPSANSDAYGDTALRNAVAQIALCVIQDRLPQCGAFDGEKLTLTRKQFGRPRRGVVMLPQHLFTINWADTAPGISWPEAYHATYILGYDRYLVTASFDCPDMHGVTELSLGHFGGERPPTEGCADVVKDWWRYLMEECCQERWAYVWDEGLIDCAAGSGWADEVWGGDHDDGEKD